MSVGYPIQNPARGRANIDGGGSSTIFASQTGGRWCMTNGFISWANLLSTVTVSLFEMDASQSAVFMTLMVSATSGYVPIVLGDVGFQASVAASRMFINTGPIAGTFTAFFSGYYTGS